MEFLLEAPLFVFLGVAVLNDLKSRCIANRLILQGLLVGFVWQGCWGGVVGLMDFALGGVVGFLLLLPFYSLGGMAAGDVKLMAMIGGFLGPMATVSAAALTLIMGSVLGIAILLYKKQLFRLVQRYWAMASLRTYIAPQADDAVRQRFPYAIAIFTGTLISLFWQPFGP